jgi:hypothetical protein
VDLADIMDQGEPRTRPLYIHFQFGPEREAVHALVHTDVGKDRLDDTCPGTPHSWARCQGKTGAALQGCLHAKKSKQKVVRTLAIPDHFSFLLLVLIFFLLTP